MLKVLCQLALLNALSSLASKTRMQKCIVVLMMKN